MSNSKFRVVTAAIALTFIVGAVGFQNNNSTAQPSPPNNSAETEGNDVELPDVEPSANAMESPKACVVRPKQPLQCFKTEAEALRVTSGGRINLAPNQTLSLSRLPYPYNAVLYQYKGYRGSRLIFLNFRCGTGANIPSWFNNRTSSLRVGFCRRVSLYQYPYFRGRKASFYYDTPWVGPYIDNRASSVSFP